MPQTSASPNTQRDRAATLLSIANLRAKADAAGAVDAMRLRAAAARLEDDLVEDDASRRDAERAVVENRRAAERFAAGQTVAMVPQSCQQQQARAHDPLCPVMDAAYFERMALKMADPAWPNTARLIADAEVEIRASAKRYAAEQMATARRLGIKGPLALTGRYPRAA